MAKGRDESPTTAPVTKPGPQGGADFKSLVNDALGQIVTTGPEGQQVPPGAAGPQPTAPLPVQQPNQHVPRPQMVSPPEDHSIASYRDMLRQEEERIAQRQAMQPMAPPMPPAMNQMLGVPQGAVIEGGKVRYKPGANKLLVECYEVLSRAVAGGMIAPYGTFYRDVQRLVQDLGVEVVDVSVPKEVQSATTTS